MIPQLTPNPTSPRGGLSGQDMDVQNGAEQGADGLWFPSLLELSLDPPAVEGGLLTMADTQVAQGETAPFPEDGAPALPAAQLTALAAPQHEPHAGGTILPDSGTALPSGGSVPSSLARRPMRGDAMADGSAPPLDRSDEGATIKSAPPIAREVHTALRANGGSAGEEATNAAPRADNAAQVPDGAKGAQISALAPIRSLSEALSNGAATKALALDQAQEASAKLRKPDKSGATNLGKANLADMARDTDKRARLADHLPTHKASGQADAAPLPASHSPTSNLPAPAMSANAQPNITSPSAAASPDARVAGQIEAAINQWAETREAGRAARPEMTVRHHEFGAVNMRIEGVGAELRATVTSRDPGFVPAVQSALAERGMTSGGDSGSGGSGQNSQHNSGQGSSANSGGQSGQNAASQWQSAMARDASAEPNYGTSRGSEQASIQPYSQRRGADEEESSATHAGRSSSSRGGIFA